MKVSKSTMALEGDDSEDIEDNLLVDLVDDVIGQFFCDPLKISRTGRQTSGQPQVKEEVFIEAFYKVY